MRGRTARLEIVPAPSRYRVGLESLGFSLLACSAVGQAIHLAALWPLLACPALLMAMRWLPETRTAFVLDGSEIRVRTSEGVRVGLWSRGRVSPLAIEIPVHWQRGGHDRVVLWRDAVTDADFRAVARTTRAIAPASSAAAALH